MLGDADEGADQLVVVLNAKAATTLQVTRKTNLIKQLASLLNQVCPQFCVYELELFVLISVGGVHAHCSPQITTHLSHGASNYFGCSHQCFHADMLCDSLRSSELSCLDVLFA